MLHSQLIKKAKKHPEAFGKIYEIYYDQIYKYVYFRTNSKETAEDLVSNIWEKILYNIADFKSNHPLSFKLWLFQITRNTLADFYRNRKETIDIEEIEISEPETITQQLKTQEFNQQVIQAIQGFPEKEKEALTLKFFAHFRNKEIAKIMNISEQTTAAYLSRATKTLQEKLKNLL